MMDRFGIDWRGVFRAALVSGTCAGLGSTVALVLAARAEGKAAMRPVNATSHWRHGEAAAAFEGVDLAHSAVGFATNHAASIFWAVFFEAWLAWRRPRGLLPVARAAAVTAAVAVIVDYGATPKRFTPGWELVLSRKGMAVAYAGLAAGLAGAVVLARRRPA